MNSLRRAACPGIAKPMQTGDGLLARLVAGTPIPIDAFIKLCAAASLHGNGIMEVTQRGSLQFRGLSPLSAPKFAQRVAALGLGDETVPLMLLSPLHGIDSTQLAELHDIVSGFRSELTGRIDDTLIGPKVSVLLDTGGTLHLDDVPADVRLRAVAASNFHLSIAGTAAAATPLGFVESDRVVEALLTIFAAIAGRGADARARDVTDSALRASLAHLLQGGAAPPPRPRCEPIGRHPLMHGRFALGVAPAFGHMHAAALQGFVRSAARLGANSMQPTFGRTLLVIGLTQSALPELLQNAAAEGFVVRPNDPRRHVIACAGAPACQSALLSTRQLAPLLADAASDFLDGSVILHLSGCAKGCAHPREAALTLVGSDSVVLRGRASDAPHGKLSAAQLIDGMRHLTPQRCAPDESSADLMSRLGTQRLLESIGAEFAGGNRA